MLRILIVALAIGSWPLSLSIQGDRTHLDQTFGTNGKVTTGFSRLRDVATSIAIQTDGKILVAGIADTGSATASDFAVARYNINGTLDPAFGQRGKVLIDFMQNEDRCYALGIQNDGKIITAGSVVIGGYFDFGVARHNTDGSVDASFGSNGKARIDFGGPVEEAYALALQPDGKIIIAGTSQRDFALSRLNADGTLDGTFGSGGVIRTNFDGSSEDIATSITIQKDGKIIVAGGSIGLYPSLGLVRYNTDGSPDLTFGVNGKVSTNLNNRNLAAKAIALQPDGKLLVTGAVSGISSAWDFFVARYDATGNLDRDFGDSGFVIADLGGHDEEGKAIALQHNGKIFIAGMTGQSNAVTDFCVMRYNSDGSLDPSFAAGGQMVTDFFGMADRIYAMAVQPDGYIVATGHADKNERDAEFALIRFQGDLPTPRITGVSVNGKSLTIYGEHFDIGARIIINGNKQRTRNDAQNPYGVLIGKKAAKKIDSGQTVILQVQNSSNIISPEFIFTRPIE
ncbi:MAG TPA: delta-60 repeat domain-containing protein [Blastocatellia bacterium]|nr:delta-60 repeat domain-containing protein [Blastocatellia bacterium]